MNNDANLFKLHRLHFRNGGIEMTKIKLWPSTLVYSLQCGAYFCCTTLTRCPIGIDTHTYTHIQHNFAESSSFNLTDQHSMFALAVDFICDHPSIPAISFVGSNYVGKYSYGRGCTNGKKVQGNMGAKNHGAILPDANKKNTIEQVSHGSDQLLWWLCCNAQVVGASFGAAGQRCMALPTAIFVEKSLRMAAPKKR